MKNKLIIRYAFVKKKIKNIQFYYDKKSRQRPAWIDIKNKDYKEKIRYLSVQYNKNILHYRNYLLTGLLLPVYYTREELKKYYDRFGKTYNEELKKLSNINAIRLILRFLRKYKIRKDSKILEIGAGTGIPAEAFIDASYNNLTLLDFSKGMLSRAMKKKNLRKCRFIFGDIRKIKLKDKFDLIVSVFSFGSDSYFTPGEMEGLYKKAAVLLKLKGYIALIGHMPEIEPTNLFVTKESSMYLMDKSKMFYTSYYVGRKRS